MVGNGVSSRVGRGIRLTALIAGALLLALAFSGPSPSERNPVQPTYASIWACADDFWCQSCGFRDQLQRCRNCIRCYTTGGMTWCDPHSTVRCDACQRMC